MSQALRDEVKLYLDEINSAHAKLDEFNVGKPHWSLPGRIERALRPRQIRYVDREERLQILDAILLTFSVARQEGSDWRGPCAVLIKLLNGEITVETCREQLSELNRVWQEYDSPTFTVVTQTLNVITGLKNWEVMGYRKAGAIVIQGGKVEVCNGN